MSTFGNHKVDPETIQRGDIVTIEVEASDTPTSETAWFRTSPGASRHVPLNACNIIAVRKPEPVMEEGDEVWYRLDDGFFHHQFVPQALIGLGLSCYSDPIMLIRGDRVIWRREDQ